MSNITEVVATLILDKDKFCFVNVRHIRQEDSKGYRFPKNLIASVYK